MNRSAPALLAPWLLAVGCAQGRAEQQAPLESETTPAPKQGAAVPRASVPSAAASSAVPVDQAVTKVVSAPKDGPRIYAKTRHVWVRPEPSAEKQWIGYLWTGGSVKLKSETPIAGPGCAKFYAIEPQGYVCADGERATVDPEDPVLKAILPYAARTDTPTPHRYGESTGAPRRYHLEGAELVFPTLPRTISEPRKQVKPRSTVAYSTETRANGQSFLLTADFAWVPKDKVVPYPEITFKGVHLDSELRLPLALFRGKDRPKYRRAGDGAFTPSGEDFKRLSFVALSGQRADFEGETYLEVLGGDAWVKQSEAVVPTPQPATPWGAPVGAEDSTGKAPKGRATWLEASIRGGWLIAYEGTKPVFVTLISAGRGGEPQPGKDLIETASTPVGTYPITGKFATATMEAPNEYIHADVPWAQNFHGPHALHGAYWHDDWGNLKSGGCINVSPIDGKELFGWTDPPIPEGWHGVRWLPWQGPATLLVVHK